MRMFLKLFVLVSLITFTISAPYTELRLRRLDPSTDVDDFELTNDANFEDGDADTVIIDNEGSDYPDSPDFDSQQSELTEQDYQENDYYPNYFSPREEARLDALTAEYDLYNGQQTQSFGNSHITYANQRAIQAKLREDGADYNDLTRFSEWLGEGAEHYKAKGQVAEGQKGEDAKQIGEILQRMSDLAAQNADLEQSMIESDKQELEIEQEIEEKETEEQYLKEDELNLQYVQPFVENDMINNENEFLDLDSQLSAFDFSSEESDIEGSGGNGGEVEVPAQPEEEAAAAQPTSSETPKLEAQDN